MHSTVHAWRCSPVLPACVCVQICEKKPTLVQNYGIWVRYQSRTGYHNMYKVSARASTRTHARAHACTHTHMCCSALPMYVRMHVKAQRIANCTAACFRGMWWD